MSKLWKLICSFVRTRDPEYAALAEERDKLRLDLVVADEMYHALGEEAKALKKAFEAEVAAQNRLIGDLKQTLKPLVGEYTRRMFNIS